MNTEDKLSVLFTGAEIQTEVKKLAGEITRAYAGKNPLLICVLKGSFIFTADLVRYLDFPLEIDFIRLSSYGSGQESSGKIKIRQDISVSVTDRDILVVEDIIDSGITVAFLLNHLKAKNPAAIRFCCLLDKPSRRKIPVTIDYRGVTVPDKFLVGYGLDWDEKYRNLPGVYYLEK